MGDSIVEDAIMKMTKESFCNHCEKEVEATLISRQVTYTFKGESFEINERVFICSCGEDIYDESLDSDTLKTLTKMYETRIGLELGEIKSIREQYGLSMELFSRILGWSKATISRYETGKFIPDSSHMFTLKKLKDQPEIIDEYYHFTKHKFTEKEQIKIAEKLAYNDQVKVEKSLVNAININFKMHERTADSGYSSFDLDKFVNMILFYAQKGVLKTKLMKLLFYADFLNFKRNLISISGVPYTRLPFGPVPKDHDLLLSTCEKNNLINIEYNFINDYSIINISSNCLFDKSLFNESELEILNEVENYFKQHGSNSISEFSHKEEGWKQTKDRDIISYDYAESLQLN